MCIKLSKHILLTALFMLQFSITSSYAKNHTEAISKKPPMAVTADFVRVKRDLKVKTWRISRGMPFCSCDKNYQPLASCNEQTFKVTLLFRINTDGKVTNPQVYSTSGQPIIDKYVRRAMRRMLFYPIAQPVMARKTVVYEHHPLKDDSCTKVPKDKLFEKK